MYIIISKFYICYFFIIINIISQIDERELDEYLFKLKSEITNTRVINDKLILRLSDVENENVNLKTQISKLAIENSTIEHYVKTNKNNFKCSFRKLS